jgi:hypothetical protein
VVERELDSLIGDPYTNVFPLYVPADPAEYRRIPDPSPRYATRYEKIIDKHGAKFQTDLELADDEAIFEYYSGLAACDDPAIVAEFSQGSRVVKYDKVNEAVGIIQPDDEHPVTTYLMPPHEVVHKIRINAWHPN